MASAMLNGDDLWRECASWLTRCDVLRNDHKANWPEASIVDLAFILRDGVLLCNLLNVLDPGCIDNKDVNQKPQMAQFLCLRNIQIFLQTSKDIFGIKDTELFDPLMLFDLTNFHRVLCTLSKLSNSQKALRQNIAGFSVHKNGSKEDIYQSLQSVGGSASSSPECSWMKFSIRCPRLDEHDEEVYEDLCYVTFSPRLLEEEEMAAAAALGTGTETSGRGHPDGSDAEYGSYYSRIRNEEVYQDLCSVRQPTTGPPFEKRDHVIKELLDTEKNYVDVLKTLKFGFLKPLGYVMRPETLRVVFRDIPELYDVHADFYRQLQGFASEGKPRLSATFLKFRERFLVYGSYCANLTEAQALLQEECERDEILNQEVIRSQLEANSGKFKLRDVLSVPMQRILKYHLLLEKLIEETARGHEEAVPLKRAREAMLDVATYINEVKRDSDHLVLLRQLQDNISDWSLPPGGAGGGGLQAYGRLLKDGELKIKSHDDQKVHMRYAFIFDRMMVLCKPVRGNQFGFKESLQLHEFLVEDVPSRPVLTREIRWSYQWLLVRRNRRTVYTLYARTVDVKRKMMRALQEALDNLEPACARATDHRLELHTFGAAASCNRCSRFLKGLIHQGYVCRVCRVAVHKACIAASGRCPGPSGAASVGGAGEGVGGGGEDGGGGGEEDRSPGRRRLWFAGEMERGAASALLERRPPGTYLLRVRPGQAAAPSAAGDSRYALSLRTDDTVRHMRVFNRRVDDAEQFYLSESRFFKSVLELVQFYEHTSLRENYERLNENARLLWPYRQLLAVVETDFKADEGGHLSLRQGSQVVVLDTHHTDGWWKGSCDNAIGVFPKECVRVLREVTQETED